LLEPGDGSRPYLISPGHRLLPSRLCCLRFERLSIRISTPLDGAPDADGVDPALDLDFGGDPAAGAVDKSYDWSPSLLHEMGLHQTTKDGKQADLGNEYPMEPKRRTMLLRDVPDIRSFRDLTPRNRLPEDPEDTKSLSEGERYWITTVAPTLHRQLVQMLSVGCFLAQESAVQTLDRPLADGSTRDLSTQEFANISSSLVTLLMDSIRTLVDFQRSRILKAGGRKAPLSVSEAQRKIISDQMEEVLVKDSERQMTLKLAKPSLLTQVARSIRGGGSTGSSGGGRGRPRRHRYSYTRFQDIRQGYGPSKAPYDPQVNSYSSFSSQPSRFQSSPYQKRGRGRGRGGRRSSSQYSYQ
jgi:hypothetical protein